MWKAAVFIFRFVIVNIYDVICLLTVGVVLFYICIIVYLYGDLAIYVAAVPKSLRDIIWYDMLTLLTDLVLLAGIYFDLFLVTF